MSEVDDKSKAELLLPEMLQMIDSDLMKAGYYLKKAIPIALIAENKPLAVQIARLHLHLENISRRVSKLNKGLAK